VLLLATMLAGARAASPPPPALDAGDTGGSGESGEDREYEDPTAASSAFAQIRGPMPSGVHPYIRARDRIRQWLRDEPVAPGAFDRQWTPLGPSDVGGRLRALAIDPTDTNVLYAGAVAGGVWKSTNGGASWAPLVETFANVGVSAIVLDPRDPAVIYVGTGEYFGSGSAGGFAGVGIMRSRDRGATWRLLPATIGSDEFRYVHDLAISAADSNVLYAGTSAGVARSTDGGDTWTTVLPAASRSGCGELAVRSDRSPDVLLASCADAGADGVYWSGDGGNTWAKVIDVVNGERGGRASIAFAPSNQDIAYASVARTNDSAGGASGTLALLRSNDGGQTWSVQNPGTVNWLGYCSDTWGQGYYGNVIAVDPTNPERIWLGGVDGFRSDDGGRTVTIAAYWYIDQVFARSGQDVPVPFPYVHADYHAIVFDPNYDGADNQTVYFGTDGGLYRTRNDRAPLASPLCQPGVDEASLNDVVYEPLNSGLAVTQFWAGTVSADGSILMGGTQDNGTWLRPAGAGPGGWRFAIGGDGFDVAVAPANDRFYGEIYGDNGIDIRRSSTGDYADFVPITGSIDDTGLFFTPFVLDPNNPQTLWTGGHTMWRSTDAGDLWIQQSEQLTAPGEDHAVSAIAIAPSDSDVVYAGSNRGLLWVTTNATASPPTWTALVKQPGYVTQLAVHPADPRTAYATIGRFGGPHLLKTIDGGATWTDVSTALPDVPASGVAINPRNPEMVFVGTDAGVFETPNGGRTWYPANGNLTSTIVQDLVFQPGTSELYVFTHGRGAYGVDVGTGA
jgi:photosystem II stability/assembly factor-like uncharacterized protein